MKLKEFRITNFRSIVDTGWCPFSRDGVTVLVGQNESGKTSVLEALATTFSHRSITADDLRSGEPLPIVYIKLECEFSSIVGELDGHPQEHLDIADKYWAKNKNQIILKFYWEEADSNSKLPFGAFCTLADSKDLIGALRSLPVSSTVRLPNASVPVKPLSAAALGKAIYRAGPTFILFNERSGTLPNQIDLNGEFEPTGAGDAAATSYLEAAQIDLPKLVKADLRSRESALTKANAKLTSDFNSFWSQTIGKETKLSLNCAIETHGLGASDEKIGKPYLVFWISDSHTRLYPSQRSRGVRWFVSFFLQLRAAKASDESPVFLLDEPGANLHSKAQVDVLKLINNLREEIPIVYSTHSPDLIEYEHLHRIHAVQRTDDEDDSVTVVLDAHRLGAASSDTLSPILAAMGTDLSRQQTVQKRDNVLLEEVSGFYYFTAFWKLTGQTRPAYFIASTGVNKLPTLANLFLGWGLDFITVVDDDNQGRGVFKELLQDLYADKHEIANRYVFKLKGYDGIEDVFSANDFKRFILNDEKANVPQKNTEFLKRSGRSKPIMALEFKLAVDNGSICFTQLEEATQRAIREVVEGVASRLAPPMAKVA